MLTGALTGVVTTESSPGSEILLPAVPSVTAPCGFGETAFIFPVAVTVNLASHVTNKCLFWAFW